MIEIPDDPSHLESIFNEMKNNHKSGQTRSVKFRVDALKNLLKGYEKLTPEFDEALKHDLGLNSFMSNFSAHSITKGEIQDLIDGIPDWVKETPVKTPIGLGLASSSIQYEPLGLVLVFSAWNYPIYTALPQVAAAIVAGNSVILKPSEMAPHVSRVLVKLFKEHMNSKYYRVVEGKVSIAKRISQLPFDLICFTGSTMTGRLVAIEAAKNLTPCLLELGGKCPTIVDQTANIDSAVLRILFGKLLNCGQTCVGVDHVYVHESISEKFKTKLLQKLKEGYGQKDLKTAGDYAKIINEGHVERLQSYLKEDHGGKVLKEGEIIKNERFMSPWIIENPKNDSLLMKEQIFGPILPIHIYKNLNDVIEDINSRPKPLVVYHFSENEKNANKVKSQTSSGSFVLNDAVVQLLNCHLPFGGVGASGSGRYHGYSGFQNFSNAKSICRTKAFNGLVLKTRFPPYTDSSKKVMTFLLKIGGTTYSGLGKAFKYSLIAAAGIGIYIARNSMPKL